MSGDIQARKRKGKGRKKDEGEDDVTETKAKIIVNDSKHGNNNGKGEGSGVVAKLFFLILLVSLSLVVGLILVELRAAVKESRSAMPNAEELYTPEPIEPEVHEEPVPEAPPPVQPEDTNEEYEPIEATPPLEEYVKVVEKVVETPQEEQSPEDDSFFQAEEADVVEEVVEVVEEIPVEEIVEIVEEVVEVPAVEEEAKPVVEEPSEEIQQEADEKEEVQEKVKEEVVQEEVKKEEPEVVQGEVKEEEEVVSSQKEKDEPASAKEKVEVVEEKEEIVADQEDATDDIEEVVEEPLVAEAVQELDAPVEETNVDDKEDEDNDQDDEPDEEKEVDDDDDDEEEEEEEEDGDDDDDDGDKDAELTEEEAEAVHEALEESIDSLVEDLESLTKAYIRVEALAEDIRSVDPENEMVAQLVPHIAGVLRALESGHTEGLADTLNHIEIILLDIQRRLPEAQPAESPQTPETEAASEPAIGTEPEHVVADSEPLSSPEATDESEPAEPQEVKAPVAHPPPVEEEAEPQEVDEPEAAALVLEPVVVESESIVDSSEAQVESSESVEQSVVVEAEPIEEKMEEVVKEEPRKEPYVVEEREPLFPLDSSEVPQEVPEEVLADIESQIIPEGEDPTKEAKEEAPLTPPREKEEGNVAPSPSPEGGDKEPVPVDEVIPDPIHIEPLQKPVQEETSKEPSPAYEKADITSETDNQIREELDEAEKELPRNPGAALNSFGALLHRYPKSARALYGRALSQDRLADDERSNTWLEKAIDTYRSVIDLADEDPAAVPLPLLRMAAEKCIDRLRFRGFMGKAVRVQQRLLQRFPDDIELRNQLGVTFLMMNQATAARDVYKAVLEMKPDDGFAQVHYGFILKTTYDNNTGGIEYMQKGIKSEAEGTQDGRFYFHLGDALQREGNTEEAYKWYDIAVEKGLFLSRYQRSLYNVDRLRSQPLWTLEETSYQEFFRKLEDNWLVIRKEGLEALALPAQDGFRPEAENLQDTGDWKQYELFTRGRKITANCVKTPKTCALVESFQAAAGCKRGQVKFSVMYPGTHVHAHTGPTNCRLRAHLGLVVPDGLRLRVGDNFVNWVEGKIFVFDDSWEHEVWHEGDAPRLILIVDVWHPELTEQEKKSLSPI